MARSLFAATSVLLFTLAIASCATTEAEDLTPEATPTPGLEMTPTSTPDPTATPVASPETEPTATASPNPTATFAPEPSPTATPEPALVSVVTETPCCGLVQWLSDDELLVFDEVAGEGDGAWKVEIETGERYYIAEGFGIPSPAGIIAFPEPSQSRLVIRDLTGTETATIPNRGEVAWPSPDGSVVAWLDNLEVRTPSSSVNRSVNLNVAEIATGESRSIRELQAAEVHWLPDSRHLLIPARDLEFEQAGLWIVDTHTGEYEVIFEEIFLQAVSLSPDGQRAAFMRTFNEDSGLNGLWTIDLVSRNLIPVGVFGPYRWHADGQHLWLLEMTPAEESQDLLVKVHLESGHRVSEIPLEGEILNDVWEISADGSYVAFWRVSDGQIVVQSLDRTD